MSDVIWKGGITAAPHAVMVYEPLGEWKFAYWVKTGMEGEEPQIQRGVAEVQEVRQAEVFEAARQQAKE